MTRRSWTQIDGVLYEKGTEPQTEAPFVVGDIEPFKDTTGTVIGGRAQWRAHLRSLGAEEMGHSDIKAAEAQHAKKKAAYNERMARAAKYVQEATPPPLDMPRRRSSLAAEVLGRLDGRPAPDRKTLVKLCLDLARRR